MREIVKVNNYVSLEFLVRDDVSSLGLTQWKEYHLIVKQNGKGLSFVWKVPVSEEVDICAFLRTLGIEWNRVVVDDEFISNGLIVYFYGEGLGSIADLYITIHPDDCNEKPTWKETKGTMVMSDVYIKLVDAKVFTSVETKIVIRNTVGNKDDMIKAIEEGREFLVYTLLVDRGNIKLGFEWCVWEDEEVDILGFMENLGVKWDKVEYDPLGIGLYTAFYYAGFEVATLWIEKSLRELIPYEKLIPDS